MIVKIYRLLPEDYVFLLDFVFRGSCICIRFAGTFIVMKCITSSKVMATAALGMYIFFPKESDTIISYYIYILIRAFHGYMSYS